MLLATCMKTSWAQFPWTWLTRLSNKYTLKMNNVWGIKYVQITNVTLCCIAALLLQWGGYTHYRTRFNVLHVRLLVALHRPYAQLWIDLTWRDVEDHGGSLKLGWKPTTYRCNSTFLFKSSAILSSCSTTSLVCGSRCSSGLPPKSSEETWSEGSSAWIRSITYLGCKNHRKV